MRHIPYFLCNFEHMTIYKIGSRRDFYTVVLVTMNKQSADTRKLHGCIRGKYQMPSKQRTALALNPELVVLYFTNDK